MTHDLSLDINADDEEAVSSASRAAQEALQHSSPSKKAQKLNKVSRKES